MSALSHSAIKLAIDNRKIPGKIPKYVEIKQHTPE